MSRACVNRGGGASIVRLEAVPTLEQPVVLSPQAVQALECWEARAGQIVTLVDPMQGDYRARLQEYDGTSAVVVPFQKLRPVESPVEIVVYQALPEKERFELVLQKLTELGVTRVVPFVSSRSVTLEQRDGSQKKSHRWPDVLLRAARQCRRAMVPELGPVMCWDKVLEESSRCELRLMLYEGESYWSLREALQKQRPESIALIVGPEGGFEQAEVKQASGSGVLGVSLGGRILRTESAAIIGAGLIQFVCGDLG